MANLKFYKFFIIILFSWDYAVAVICHPNSEHIICEDETCTLLCKSGEVINIIYANYGRTDKYQCVNWPFLWNVNCLSSMAMSKISANCASKTSCIVKASNNVFGDPCPGVKKYVSLKYSCSERTTPSTSAMTKTTWMSSSTQKTTGTSEVATSTSKTTGTSEFAASTSDTTGTSEFAASTSKTTGTSEFAASASKTTGIIIAVVVLFGILIVIVAVLFYRRRKFKREDPKIKMNFVSKGNSRGDENTTRTSIDNPSYTSDPVYHQYCEITSATQKENTGVEYSSYVLDYSRSCFVPGNLDAQEMNDDVGLSEFKCEDMEDHGAYFILDLQESGVDSYKGDVNGDTYFILDPNETGVDRLKNSHVQKATTPYPNEVNYELAQCTDKYGSTDNYSVGQYGDLDDYNHVQNTNQTIGRREELYDHVVDGVYDVSAHDRNISNDSDYDQFDGIES